MAKSTFTLKYFTTPSEAILSTYNGSKKWLPNDNWIVVKLRGSHSFEFSPESEGKTRYMIAEVNSKGEFKNLGILKQYEAVIQLKELFENYPKVLKRKDYTPNKNGTMSAKFLTEIGTNAISENFDGVPTLQECKAFMNARFKGTVKDYMS
jgi:methyltransferase-like protein